MMRSKKCVFFFFFFLSRSSQHYYFFLDFSFVVVKFLCRRRGLLKDDVSFLRSFGIIMSLPAKLLFSPQNKKSVLPSSSAVVHHCAGSKKAARCSSSSPSRGVGVHRFFFVSPTTSSSSSSSSSPKNKTLHHRRGGVQKPRGEHSRNRALADDVTELNAWSADEQKKAVDEILENVDDGGARKIQRFCSFFFFLFSLNNAFVLVK